MIGIADTGVLVVVGEWGKSPIELGIEFDTPGKVTGHPIAAGDRVLMESAGGGGYGDPLHRDPEAVRADIVAGYVTEERACDGYGVVLDDAGSVDRTAAARREQLAAARPRLSIVADERSAHTGGKGMRRMVRLGATTAERLGVVHDTLIELRGAHPAPLRAWTRVEDGVADGDCPMDAFGRRVLGVAPGNSVVVRTLPTPRVAAGLAG